MTAPAAGGPSLGDLGGWPAVLGPLTAGNDLTAEQAAAAMAEILAGEASPAQIAGFIVALRMKGETVEEMAGLLDAMEAAAEHVVLPSNDGVIDVVGTGGDRSGSINVSTITSFVVAGAGARVCKHGNRAASSQCGSADVLEALGVAIDLGPEAVATCIEQAGIGFCFAPRYHAAIRHSIPTRRDLGVPTVFNFLGPLANPAGVHRHLLGVSDGRMAEKMAGVLRARGSKRALVVYGHDGLDEITTTTLTSVVELTEDGSLKRYELDPGAYGITKAEPAAIRGGDRDVNAGIARTVLAGEPGPARDIVVLNSAGALIAAGLAGDLPEGLTLAAAAIDDGRAAAALDRLVAASNAAA